MRLLSAAVCTTVAAALLASCSGNGMSPSNSVVPSGSGATTQARHHGGIAQSTIPKQFMPTHWDGKLHGKKAPQSEVRGIYVSEFYATTDNVMGYPKNNSSNQPPICYVSTNDNVNDLNVDTKGSLIVPNAFDGVNVYAPGMCGSLQTTITDSYGQASGAAALNATSGPIVVDNIFGSSNSAVVTCTASSGTCTPLNTPGASEMFGVAMDRDGNCYADGLNASGITTLWYYSGCSSTGQAVSGFSEPFGGSVSVDSQGRVTVVSLFNSSFSTPSQVDTYSGCSTGTCTHIATTALLGESVFGSLGRRNARFIVGDITFGQEDIYQYHQGNLTYLYSFNNGVSGSEDNEGVAYSPGAPL